MTLWVALFGVVFGSLVSLSIRETAPRKTRVQPDGEPVLATQPVS